METNPYLGSLSYNIQQSQYQVHYTDLRHSKDLDCYIHGYVFFFQYRMKKSSHSILPSHSTHHWLQNENIFW